MAKKMVYVILDHIKELEDGEEETHILGVASTIDKANEFIKNHDGFYLRITKDIFTVDEIDNDRMKRIVITKSAGGFHSFRHELRIYGRYMIE